MEGKVLLDNWRLQNLCRYDGKGNESTALQRSGYWEITDIRAKDSDDCQ